MDVGSVTGVQRAGSISYILNNNCVFSPIQYKVLQNQAEKGFICPAIIMHNGLSKLQYNTEQYQPFSSLLSYLTPDNFLLIINNLLIIIAEVKNNGFLDFTNIDFAPDKIFINTANISRIHLIYLPVVSDYNTDAPMYEREIKKSIIEMASIYPVDEIPAIQELVEKAKDPLNTIENLLPINIPAYHSTQGLVRENSPQKAKPPMHSGQNIQHTNQPVSSPKPKKERSGFFGRMKKIKQSPAQRLATGESTEILSNVFVPTLTLSSVSENLELLIDKEEYIVGKKQEIVNGYIPFNKSISRTHCKFIYKDKGFVIVDMGSSNGTFVNGVRIDPNYMIPIHEGDKIRLSNSDFIIKAI